MNKNIQAFKYIAFDFIGSVVAWTLFFFYRKRSFESFELSLFPDALDTKYYLGVIIIPVFWVIFYYAFDFYKDVFRRSRLKELGKSIIINLLGCTVIFFTIILDDVVVSYKNYYSSFLVLNAYQFIFTYPLRLALTSITIYNIHKRKWGFNSIIVGSKELALNLYEDIDRQEKYSGNKIVGFVNVQDSGVHALEKHVPCLGHFNNLSVIIKKYSIEEVLIAIEPKEHEEIQRILNRLLNENIVIKAIPDMHDILMGKVKMSTIFDTPLIHITHDLMPLWQRIIKSFIDFFAALISLLLLSPLCLVLIVLIKSSSKGSIIYRHIRIGKHGKPFVIYKFRSMYENSEPDGPALSCKGDTRITPIGRFMRKSRLDEIPNFLNVLKGDMSLVGPRPERQYYIDRIVQKAPHYTYLQKVKPGITSWGQVKYGYAENVEQMVERLKYDILYLENMSLYVDFKIIIYTLITVFKGKGL